MIPNLTNHLWQSTLFGAAAGLLTLAFRHNRAQTRYWLWLAASLKFLLPFSLLVSLGGTFGWRVAPASAPAPAFRMVEAMAQPFVPSAAAAVTSQAHFNPLPFLFAIWLCGFAALAFVWLNRWRRIRRIAQASSPAPLQAPIPLRLSPSLVEPGVFGIVRPVLLLPEGITARLSPAQLRSIVAHELCHVRRRDNLTGALHMLVEAIFWFHPLVWWIGARLVEERERACDEEVCSRCDREVYAEAILDVCRYYAASPLACAPGVTGADLRRRIESIMTHRAARPLHLGKRLLLAGAAGTAFAVPLAIGVLHAPAGRAQTAEPNLNFAVASVKPSEERRFMTVMPHPGGRLTANAPVRLLIQNAYNLQAFQITGGPDWIDSDRFNIEAKAEGNASRSELLLMLRGLLEDRFKLKVHHATKELPVYALVPARNSLKLPSPAGGSCVERDPDAPLPPPPPPGGRFAGPCGAVGIMMSPTGMRMQGGKVPMSELARMLSVALGRTVVDRTGYTDKFDVNLEFIPDQSLAGLPSTGFARGGDPAAVPAAADPSGPTIFSALREQLGLKLDSTRGPVEILVVDHVEKPAAN